ncbi:uncharacterized protein Z518_04886 [Rhinocladiella mackenziei CBS 650.93]|uniref:Uncharacterized protein n=1 Tax=Rhinocladiella mackenziei CBS 650.93 TaxID=1442369 RepID=A0A0D2JCR5_9EURO|nr:uncharacterized protein Z518_04886 [Rhinocladiella mackenziei CBS 650.93]KIX06910.1 hypothetical protein Z518_04886 [Rhinocladiella mackenziei CBS 650.93]
MEAMSSPEGDPGSQGAAYSWVLEHLLAYPGTYEIPLRTMYALNAATQNQQCPSLPTSPTVIGNAFPRKTHDAVDEQSMATVTAAAQLRANLMTHISQLPSQPMSLPPSFITSFVRRCFPPELEQVDFPQALTAMDYLKDLEVRRRREVVAALDKLGIERDDISHRDKLARKYPGVLRWVMDIEDKERKIEALYTQVYLGLRRWTMINELSLTPFNKANCLAMLSTLYPPITIQPTAQLTPKVLADQGKGFFKYITAVERHGPSVLSKLMDQGKRPEDATGWTGLRETLDDYVCMANSVIDECYEITGRDSSPIAASFSSAEYDEDGRSKVDSAISFGSAGSSNRNSGQSHATRPSTSSSFSTGSRNHSRQVSRDKQLPEKPLPPPKDDDIAVTQKTSGSTLERIARELRKMKSRNNVNYEPRPRTASAPSTEIVMMDNSERPPPTPAKDRGLSIKRSIRRIRSNTSPDDGSHRPTNRNDEQIIQEIPAFDADEMRRRRQEYDSQAKAKEQTI